MDFRTFSSKSMEFVELGRQGSNIERYLMKDKHGEHRKSFN
jgi:hypothetical protein